MARKSKKTQGGIVERTTDETSNEEIDLDAGGVTVAEAASDAIGAGDASPAAEAIATPSAASGPGGVAVVLDPKVNKIQTQIVGPDGRVRMVRFDAGKVYVLPHGCRWGLRPPVGLISKALPGATPVDLDAITVDAVTRHRLVVVQPRLAAARAFLASVLGPEQAALIAAQGNEALVATYNEVKQAQGSAESMELPPLLPPDPAGVFPVPAAMAERMKARLAPPEPPKIAEDIFAALGQGEAAAPARERGTGHPFFDSEADED